MASDKSTVYVDIDDEITAIIDKVTSAQSKIVALVLPKRATAVQSLVNMKLLKRAAEDNKKQLVLVTSESGLIPLAGAAGLFVAKTLNSKPEIPQAPDGDDAVETIDEDGAASTEDFDARKDENKPIGEVAGLGAAATAPEVAEDEPIEFDNSEPTPAEAAAPKPKKGKDKHKRIPNFGKFRNRALIALLVLVGLGVLFYFALEVWPHATVKIYTNQTDIPLNFTANLDGNADSVEPAGGILPATPQTEQKSYSQTVSASGQKDEGNKATGSVTFTVCTPFGSPPDDVASGTFISANNLNFITQGDASFSPTYQPCNGGLVAQSNSVDIVAQHPGDNYNLSSNSFQVNGSDATGSGSTSGGSSNVVRVVQDSDIKAAKAKLKSQSDNAMEQTLKSELEQNNLTPLTQTFTTIPSDETASANAGDQADNVTVTENVTYVMFGYKESDMKQLIAAKIGQQISSSQSILDDGLGQASFKLNGTPNVTTASVGINTTVVVGPKLNKAQIIRQAEGKKAGDVRANLEHRDGVSKVEVDLSPFWVGSVPNDSGKIKIQFVKQNG